MMKIIQLLIFFLLLNSISALAGTVNVAVASNFSTPMQQIADQFEQKTQHKVTLSPGSTGKLFAQIQHGAPFDLFLSADNKKTILLEQQGLAVAHSSFIYARGQLALWSNMPNFLDQEATVFKQGKFKRLAIADPKLAPYGQAAQETLQALKLWDKYSPKIITAENITKSWQFAATGNVELAFVAYAQIKHTQKPMSGSYWLVPNHLHQPIEQAATLLKSAQNNQAARALLDYLKSNEAKQIIEQNGYLVSQ